MQLGVHRVSHPLRGDDSAELPPHDVAMQRTRSEVDPTEYAVEIDDVERQTDVRERIAVNAARHLQ